MVQADPSKIQYIMFDGDICEANLLTAQAASVTLMPLSHLVGRHFHQ